LKQLTARGAGLGLVMVSCAVLTACAASAPKGPATGVTIPKVGRPAPPSSVQAALSSDPFTGYAALGYSADDGLAPEESNWALAGSCMAAAGYGGVGANAVPMGFNAGAVEFAFAQPWGNWGYLGFPEARQYGFLGSPGSFLSQAGISAQPVNLATLPQAEQTAALTCGTIVANFSSAMQAGPLATIITLNNDFGTEVANDPAVNKATKQWAACMARNGYHYAQPAGVAPDQIHQAYGGQRTVNASNPVSPAARQAQITAAVTDATCTRTTDLAGIYFAVLASYEQQLVTANQQVLTAGVRRYRAAYAKELKKLPALLRTTKPLTSTSR
jgi:hypothetical protein